MSSSPPPTKKFFLKPSALKVPTPSLDSAPIPGNSDEPAKNQSTSIPSSDQVDVIKESGTSLLRPSALKVQTPSTPQDIKNLDATAVDPPKVSFAPLTPPKESVENTKPKSPATQSELKDNNDIGQSITNGHKPMFVFGERLEDRVTISEQSTSPNAKKAVEDQSKPKSIRSSEKDLQSVKDEEPEKEGAKKRPFEVLTGEEDESNVLQIHCKLYQWETVEAVWREKGNGSLKLNDRMKDGKLCSRLVMRTSGNLKVILNSSLVVGMSFSRSNEKSLRFTNVDGIYTVKGKEKDIELLFSAVDYRLRELAKKMKSDAVSDSTDSDKTENIKRGTEIEEDETNSRSEVDDDANTVKSAKVSDTTPLEGGGCFSTIREQTNTDDLSN